MPKIGVGGITKATAPHPIPADNGHIRDAGDVIATVKPDGDGTNITVEITFRTKGMLSAMFFPAIKQALSTGFLQQIEDLAARDLTRPLRPALGTLRLISCREPEVNFTARSLSSRNLPWR